MLSQINGNAPIGMLHPFILWALADERDYLAGVPRTGKILEVISEAVKGTPRERGRDRALFGTGAGYDVIEPCYAYLVDSVFSLFTLPHP